MPTSLDFTLCLWGRKFISASSDGEVLFLHNLRGKQAKFFACVPEVIHHNFMLHRLVYTET